MSLIVPSSIEWLNLDGRKGYAVNPFKGCAHGCGYCWSREIQRVSKEDWGKPRLKTEFTRFLDQDCLALELGSPVKEDRNVLLSASTDFFQPDESYDHLLKAILVGLQTQEENHLWVLTKSSRFKDFMPYLLKARVGVTITSLSHNGLEAFAPAPVARLLSLQEVKKAGCFTFISIEPWIPGLTLPSEIIEATADYCDWWIVGSLNRMMRPVDPAFYREALPAFLEWVSGQHLHSRVYIKKELRKLE